MMSDTDPLIPAQQSAPVTQPPEANRFSLVDTATPECEGSCAYHRPLRWTSALIIGSLLGFYATLNFAPEIAAAIPDVLFAKTGLVSSGRQGHCASSCQKSDSSATAYVCPNSKCQHVSPHSAAAATHCEQSMASDQPTETPAVPQTIQVGELATFIGKTGCAACEFDVHPLQNRDELGLGLLLDDGRIVVIEQAHTLYPDLYADRFSRQLVKVTGKVLQSDEKNTWIEPTELSPATKISPAEVAEPSKSTTETSTSSETPAPALE